MSHLDEVLLAGGTVSVHDLQMPGGGDPDELVAAECLSTFNTEAAQAAAVRLEHTQTAAPRDGTLSSRHGRRKRADSYTRYSFS